MVALLLSLLVRSPVLAATPPHPATVAWQAPSPTLDPAARALAAPDPRSLYRISPARDGALIAAGVLTVAVPYLFLNGTLDQRCPCDPAEVNAIDRGVIGNHSRTATVAADLTVGLAVAGPAFADLVDLGVGRTLGEDLTVYAETLWLNGALVAVTKYVAQRPLPRTYAGDEALIHSAAGYRAFYSGHTATTVAALTAAAFTLEQRYGPRLWPWLVTAGLGASVGFEVVAAGSHFYSDVLVGGVAGAAVGYLVPRLHLRGEGAAALRPLPVRGGAGLAYVRAF
nr:MULTISPECIES: phosphatase PAP2 family protein [Myxococcaceae]